MDDRGDARTRPIRTAPALLGTLEAAAEGDRPEQFELVGNSEGAS